MSQTNIEITREQIIYDELTELARKLKTKRSLLKSQQVLDAARDVKSALHYEFIWDDSEAGEKYRLLQAQRLIQIVIVMPVKKDLSNLTVCINPPTRKFVSLLSDRSRGGGYRDIEDVMKDAKLRDELLKTAFMELGVFKSRFYMLGELNPVFIVINKVIKAYASKGGEDK
jgi:hypothetical protein